MASLNNIDQNNKILLSYTRCTEYWPPLILFNNHALFSTMDTTMARLQASIPFLVKRLDCRLYFFLVKSKISYSSSLGMDASALEAVDNAISSQETISQDSRSGCVVLHDISLKGSLSRQNINEAGCGLFYVIWYKWIL